MPRLSFLTILKKFFLRPTRDLPNMRYLISKKAKYMQTIEVNINFKNSSDVTLFAEEE